MKYAINQLDIDLRGLKQGLVNLRGSLHKKVEERDACQRGVDNISNQIADHEARIEEVSAALTLLNATQFIADESKGSISAEDLGL